VTADPQPPKTLTEDRVREIVREELGLIANKAPRPSTHEALELLLQSVGQWRNLRDDGLFRGHIEFPGGSESA
jgi:hypothetical protein